MAAKVPGWIERLLIPKLSSMEGELKGMKGELNGFRAEVAGEFKAVHAETRRVDEKIDSLRNEMLTKFEGIEKRLDFAKEIGALRAKVTELEARMPRV